MVLPAQELAEITEKISQGALDGITAGPVSGYNILAWQATIAGDVSLLRLCRSSSACPLPPSRAVDCFDSLPCGQVGTPWEGGTFKLKVDFPPTYPFEPPQVQFETKMYHPNIDHNGAIGLPVLEALWAPACTIITGT